LGCGSVYRHDGLVSADAERPQADGLGSRTRRRDGLAQRRGSRWHLWCVGAGKSLTPFPKPPAQAQLVRRGIYSIMRHPIYAGLIALSFGWAYLWDSGRGMALALIQAVLLDIKARREERWLREKFPDYDEYAVKVRRLIPWLY
jgi:protein-S-isoprenylcysteine O-methyltransferase Ste14